jgi:HSP20 family protein
MLVRWTPFTETDRLTHAMNRLFDTHTHSGAVWTPAIDVSEDADKITLAADLPGLAQKDLEIQIEKDVLTLKGQRQLDRAAEGEHYRRFERLAGTFVRSFTLPPTVDVENVSAQLKDGVLTLVLPKRAEARPRQIKVNVQ